jgi:phytoene dehydrogenase-like protein
VNSIAVVIGAGVNELAAAHVLARAGRRVLVLDRRAAHEQGAADIGWVAPCLVRDLELERHGLKIHRPDPWAVVPLPHGGRLELWNDVARTTEGIRWLSPKDAAIWPAFCERMARLARALESLYVAPPPDPMGRAIGNLVEWARTGLRLRRLGRQGIEDLLRSLPMPVADLLDDWFECDALKGALGAAGIMHLHQGPRSGGTALNLLHHHVGCMLGVFRSPLSNIGRVLAGLPGIDIRSGAEVARITVREGRATGVVLESGEEIAATLVLSGADPKRTLLGLLDPGWLEPEFARAVRNIRSRGVVARVTLVLDRAPGFSTLVVAPSLDYLERAYDDAKYGRVSQRPYLEACVEDRTVHVHLQYAPYALVDGQWDAVRHEALGDSVVQVLAADVPGFSETVIDRSVLSPPDLEKLLGWPEGQMHHAEPALDQWLWMRPVPGWARYRTPIDGLYLCGPGTHPGGGVSGASGYHCARQVQKDLR